MKKILLLFILIYPGICISQDFTVPEYRLAKAEDYKEYASEVKKAMQWVISTPVDKPVENREDIQAFVLKWLKGSPLIDLVIRRPFIDPLLSSSSDFQYGGEMMLIYLSSMALHDLKSSGNTDELSLQEAGIEGMIVANNKMAPENQSQWVQKLERKKERERLKKWIKRKIK